MSQLTVQHAFDLALQRHRAGRLQAAEQLYRQILAQEPRHSPALHYLGVIAYQNGRTEIAVDLIRKAIALSFNTPQAHSNLGNALKKAGQLDEAVAAYRQAIALGPNSPQFHNNLGNALTAKGQIDEAIAAYHKALDLNPDLPEAHTNLGTVLKTNGRLDEAVVVLRQGISLRPNFAKAYCNLGSVLLDNGQLDEAIAACRQAVTLDPKSPEAWIDLGYGLAERGQLDEAIAAARQSIALDPRLPGAYGNLGVALAGKDQLDEAISAYGLAIALQPDLAEAHSNLGDTLHQKGQLDEAIAACRQAIGLKPGCAEGHYNLALTLLQQGNFAEGWDEHEWRWQTQNFPSPQQNFSQPQWDGSDLAGRTILLHAEQGFGDAIQFIRYAPLVAARGGTVLFMGAAGLRRLFQGTIGITQWLAPHETPPAFDVHCPLMSLPLAFDTCLQSIPASVPYMHPDPGAVERWQKKLTRDHPRHKVGLAWAGQTRHRNDRNRSIPLASLAPLAEVMNVTFYSLQKGSAGKQAKTPRAEMTMIDWTDELTDFADTAALIANLDLVISVDTAVAHLAGAMGKPVWTLLPFVPDWRWLLDREDSPWYPTMRLFRQPTRGDWDSVIQRLAEALSHGIATGATFLPA